MNDTGILYIYLQKDYLRDAVAQLKHSNHPQRVYFFWNEFPLAEYWLKYQPLSIEKAIGLLRPALDYYASIPASGHASIQNWEEIFEAGPAVQFEALSKIFESVREPFPTKKILPVSVLICTASRPEMLRKSVQSLQDATYQPEEIIIIDNNPADDRTAAIVNGIERVIYVQEPRRGLSIARNTGLRTANQEIVAFIDDDVEITDDWLALLYQSFDDPAVMAMTGLVLPKTLAMPAQLNFEEYWSFDKGLLPKIYDQSFLSADSSEGPAVWEIGAGANMAFRKSALEKTGFFDERLGAGASGCSEDSEYWFRMLTQDLSIRYEPRCRVYHTHREDFKGLKHQLFMYMRGFVSACLLQQSYYPAISYNKHLTQTLPAYYKELVKEGLPFFRGRYSTLFAEMRGIRAGYRYYRQMLNQKPVTDAKR